MSHSSSRLSAVLVAAAVSAAISGTAVAQAQLEEVTVTARKRAESLQEVPISVTAFTAEAIESRGIRNVSDVIKYTPGLSFDKGFAPQDTRPNIRGLPTTRGRPPVGILLDNIDISSESIATAGGSSLMNLKLVDVERIEVVKGPQSALYGRVAFGGAINYVSKKPTFDEVQGNLNLDVATDGLYEARGAINLPIGESTAIRVNGLYSKFDGFYKNEVSGETIGGWETKGIAAQLRFAPSETSDWTLRLSYSEDDAEPRPSYYNGQAIPGKNQLLALPANAVGLRLGVPPGGAPLPATIRYPITGEAKNGDRVLLSVDPLTGKDYEGGQLEAFIASLSGEVDFGFATLNSWTGYTSAKALSRSDADFYAAPSRAVTVPVAGNYEPLAALSVTSLDTDVTQLSQELRLGDLEGKGLRWAVGALYWKEDYESYNASLFINGFARNAPIPSPLFPAGWSAAAELVARGALPGDRNFRNTEHTSGYLILEYDITDKLDISAEGRYGREKFDYLFGRAYNPAVSPTGQVLPTAFAGQTFTPSSSTNYFAPKVTLNYKPTDDASIYATVSKGVKPAGFLNVGVVLDANDAKYNSEILWNYELGFKSSWLDDRLRFNAAYFHMVYEDRISQQLVPDSRSPQGTSTLVVNQGEAKVDGIELELTAGLTESVTASIAYTYLDPRFTDSEVPTVAALTVAGSGNCRVGTVGPQTVCFTNTNGNQLEQSAKHALVASLLFNKELSNGWTMNGELNAQYRSKRYTGPDNLIWLPAYTNVDASIGLDSGDYSVSLYVTNLLDYDKPTSSQSYGDPFIAFPVAPPVLAYTTYPADPRQVGLRVNFRF